MVHSMKVTGKTINCVGQVNLQKLMEPYTRVTFLMAKCTVKGNTATKMGLHKKVIGLKVSKMAMESRHTQMGLVMKDNIKMDRSMDKAHLLFLMGQFTKVHLKMVLCKVKESSIGLMTRTTMACGQIIKCMAKEFSSG